VQLGNRPGASHTQILSRLGFAQNSVFVVSSVKATCSAAGAAFLSVFTLWQLWMHKHREALLPALHHVHLAKRRMNCSNSGFVCHRR
jgi:hypothetical protein